MRGNVETLQITSPEGAGSLRLKWFHCLREEFAIQSTAGLLFHSSPDLRTVNIVALQL